MPVFTIATPEGRNLKIEADSEDAAIRGAQTWSMQQKSAKPKRSSVLDQIGAFAQSATEQVPFLDEAAAGAVSMASGRPYKDVRQAQSELAAEDRRERPLARNAGGVAGFTATMAAPGGNYIKGAKSLGQGAVRSAQVGAGYGALAGAGGGDGDLEERAARGAEGAGVGAITGAALPVVGRVAAEALKKAPKTMNLEQLGAAKKAAYADPALKGVVYSPEARAELAKKLQNEAFKLRLNPKRHKGAASVLADVVGDLKGSKPVSLEDMDNLRQIVWRDAAGLKDPDRASEAMMGNRFIELMDDFVDKADGSHVVAGDPGAAAQAMRSARDLNTRWRKAQTVTNELESAELRKSAAYSGANTDNAIRQRLRPLVDPTSGKRIRNATGDEKTALKRVVDGSPMQNLERLASQGLDPRKLLGKITGLGAAGGALPTGGLSLALPALGLAATTMSNRASQKNVEGLLSLIAAGGSKEALKKAPTAASRAVGKRVQQGQELPGLLGHLAQALATGGL